MSKTAMKHEDIVESAGFAASMKAFLEKQRWFRSKERKIKRVEIADWTEESAGGELVLRLLARVRFDSGEPETYFVPVVSSQDEPHTQEGLVAALETGGKKKYFLDAFGDPAFAKRLFDEMSSKPGWEMRRGRVVFSNHSGKLPANVSASELKSLGAEQSNSAIIYKKDLMLKIFRKMEGEASPEVEMLVFLNERGYEHAPGLRFDARYEAPDGGSSTLMLMLDYVANTGDGWKHAVASLDSIYKRFLGKDLPPPGELGAAFVQAARGHLDSIRELGAITGAMHATLGSEEDDPAFRAERIDRGTVEKWRAEYEALVSDALRLLEKKAAEDGGGPAAECRAMLAGAEKLRERSRTLSLLADESVCRIRCHEDFHLGQVLRGDSGWVICDFEGQPSRGIRERKEKYCVLKDVAGMLRSFDYAAHVSGADFRKQYEAHDPSLARLKRLWLETTRRAFLSAYFEEARAGSGSAFLSASGDKNAKLLSFFELEKSFSELVYELKNRPDWIWVPAEGIRKHLI